MIEVRNWPGNSGRGIRVSTDRTDRGRGLVATGFKNFVARAEIGSARLHVPGRGEPSLMVVQLRIAEDAITATRRDAVVGILACALDIAEALSVHLGIGDGCLEWKVDEARVADALKLNPTFKPVSPKARHARRLRGQRILRSE